MTRHACPALPDRDNPAARRYFAGSNRFAISLRFTFTTMNTTKKLVALSTTLVTVLGLTFNAFAAAPAETLPSGVKIVHTVDGTGAQPKASDTVKVHYRGTLADGTEFDSSIKRGTPASFPLNRVVPCWTEGMQKIKVGGKATLTCPPATAYGSRGAGAAVPPNATLTFEVELLAIEK
jgi:FKBP-type peptidyl-prolyl cis-trans isomerase FkpA